MDIRATSSNADINAVLQQMRQIRDQSKQIDHLTPAALDRTDTTKDTSRADFGGALKGAIDTVNQLQQSSSASQTAFATGAENNLVKVMIDSQKSNVGFQAMVQVRNRMVTAYQDIMKMPI